ncbi:hypothetical protein M885DRAFT_543480 [Pelagophyceae sp. CCMP2097]|nr:hypothetical protein M885DRAFT_543480 [Pelagophyceae sp. CCMP2097]
MLLLTLLLCCATGLVPWKAAPRSPAPRGGGRRAAAAGAVPAPPAARGRGSVLESALLVCGATVGSGFLAVPRATCRAGIGPATAGLAAVWVYHLLGALALAEAAARCRHAAAPGDGAAPAGGGGVSIFSISVEATRGWPRPVRRGVSLLMSACFSVVVLCTLTSQVAKTTDLLVGAVAGAAPAAAAVARLRLGTAAAAAAAAYGVAFCVNDRFAERVTSACGALMLASFAALLGACFSHAGGLAPAAVLQRGSWAPLLPRGGEPWAVGIFVQLLVFGEAVCLVVRRLETRRDISAAIALGSAMPLAMAIALTAAAVNLNVPGVDPLAALLARGRGYEAAAVGVFCVTAVASTAVGTLLSAAQFFDDAVAGGGAGGGAGTSGAAEAGARRRRRAVRVATVALPAVVASSGNDVAYRALAFAGGFPVTVLWGVLPPLFLWALRRRPAAGDPSRCLPDPGRFLPGGTAGLAAVQLLALALLGADAATHFA